MDRRGVPARDLCLLLEHRLPGRPTPAGGTLGTERARVLGDGALAPGALGPLKTARTSLAVAGPEAAVGPEEWEAPGLASRCPGVGSAVARALGRSCPHLCSLQRACPRDPETQTALAVFLFRGGKGRCPTLVVRSQVGPELRPALPLWPCVPVDKLLNPSPHPLPNCPHLSLLSRRLPRGSGWAAVQAPGRRCSVGTGGPSYTPHGT